MPRTRLMSRLKALAQRSARARPAGDADRAPFTRRDLLTLGAAVAAAPAWKCDFQPFGGKTIVIGGGLAGLHCAWRLVEQGVETVVVEAQARVGGRQFTGRGLFANGQSCELGGEFIDTNHATMWALADEFAIAIDDRWADELPDTVRDTWWIGGRRVTDAEIIAQFELVAPAIVDAFNAAETDDYQFALLDGTTMADYLLDVCPPAVYPELHALLTSAYRGEYGLETAQQSCLNLVYLIDAFVPDPFAIYGASDERYHAHEGNDVFCTRLADAVGWDKIALETKLVEVRDHRFGGYEVELEDATGARFTDCCDHVVFALPFTKLREVNIDVRRFNPNKQRAIDELGYGTNAKVIGGFDARTWFDVHNASGSVTTDLPFQQVWDSSIGQGGAGAVLTNFVGGDQGIVSGTGAPEDWFAGILPDLEGVWPGVSAAWDGSAVRQHWPSFEWSLGAYTCYLPGQWSFFGKEGRRVKNLHFCGEHCSLDFQGWMEGAAETGALVAAEILDDLGLRYSARHAPIVAFKTLAPQACYHGDLLPDALRPLTRRRAVLERVRALREPDPTDGVRPAGGGAAPTR